MLFNQNSNKGLSFLVLPVLTMTLSTVTLSAASSAVHGQEPSNDSNLIRKLDANIQIVDAANKAGRVSQKKIEAITEQTEDMLVRYLDSYDNLTRYQKNIAHLETIERRQREQKSALNQQLETLSETEMALVPMLLSMIDTLDATIKRDLPFLLDERQSRVAALRQAMSAPDVSLPNKYRQVLEAYEVERDYGYTLETYTQELSLDGQETLVRILRLGRIGLYYQTTDGLQQGLWHRDHQTWLPLDGYASSISEGIAMANEKASPKLLNLPLLPHQYVNAQQASEAVLDEGGKAK